MQTTPFQTVVNRLTKDQTPRVWSLLISVFGELAQEQGSRISGSLLRHMTERIGIKPEAMRVAIHRLRKDGWIDSERQGRTSAYFLTAWGRAQSALASPRIYASEQAADQAWLVMFNPGQPAQNADASGGWITSNVLVTSVPPDLPQVFVAPLGVETALPHWVTGKVCDDTAIRMSREFATALDEMRPYLNASSDFSTFEIAVIRVLLVHGWRRIVLKAPVLPDHVFPDGWRGQICRETVTDLLSQYPKRSLDELEAAITAGHPGN
ncbi:PaaX family transcriptional regulator C-terminal domain-containing protein [Sedimentitalea todarodis]|uniref:PaaX family transcriptional regulator C-terminal domain-containing protein n=1 Tax=Sedimentitalea todarodis TaxID=1631240 RepID=A0ABU3VH61_9RHOB|nr:PaaX family transcriptional regulator C-terminal domain-containing protein [Sedimentitalea todarodis]MDU9005526.1 PaaX family transcriptional regulator C-terminal domain-containing protein [Sedimentitalea todarodis]